jgi:hypothetical protein
MATEDDSASTNGASPNADGDPKATEPKKVGRLPFFGIGESDLTDVSERFEEYLGIAIDKRHPRSPNA